MSDAERGLSETSSATIVSMTGSTLGTTGSVFVEKASSADGLLISILGAALSFNGATALSGISPISSFTATSLSLVKGSTSSSWLSSHEVRSGASFENEDVVYDKLSFCGMATAGDVFGNIGGADSERRSLPWTSRS